MPGVMRLVDHATNVCDKYWNTKTSNSDPKQLLMTFTLRSICLLAILTDTIQFVMARVSFCLAA